MKLPSVQRGRPASSRLWLHLQSTTTTSSHHYESDLPSALTLINLYDQVSAGPQC